MLVNNNNNHCFYQFYRSLADWDLNWLFAFGDVYGHWWFDTCCDICN